MRYHILPILLLALQAQGQTLVSELPQQRSVLFEEYTAINCGNCPAGHALAANLVAANPGQVSVVAVHGGGLAVPGQGQPDLRAAVGTALWQHYGVTSQPRAAINRLPVNGQTVVSTSQWAAAVEDVLSATSPVNIGVASSFDPGPRILTLNVELFYTADGPGAADRITVELVQDHIIGYQQDYQNGAHANYDHRHVLRACITDLWGDEVSTTTPGSFVQRSYAFTVPAEWDIADLEVVAFVSEHQGEVYQARSVAADGGFTTGEMEVEATSEAIAPPFPSPAVDQVFVPTGSSERSGLLRVMDSTGRMLKSVPVTKAPLHMDVRDLPSGIYLFSIEGLNGTRAGRFVVAR